MDGSMIKNVALQMATLSGNVATGQANLIKGLVSEILDGVPMTSAVAIVDEGTGKFSKDEREANKTAYQYASRIKSIFGAYVLSEFDESILSGDVNSMYTTSVKYLRTIGKTWKGEDVSAKQAAKEQAARVKAESEQLHALAANRPQAVMADLMAEVQANVDAQQAAEMLAKLEERAEKSAAKLVEQLGRNDAMVYARALLAAVATMVNA